MEATMRLVVAPGVFRPRSDSWMLTESVRALPLYPEAEVVDLCTGSGVVAIGAARAGARTTAVDVSRRAVLTVRLNARLNGMAGRVRAVRGDLFEPLHGRRFDVIASNPPYVPTAREKLPARGPARAWEAGPDGRVVLDRICGEAPRHLRSGGTLMLVQSSLCGIDLTLEALGRAGLEARVLERRRGPLGPLMLSRAEELERRGVLQPRQREEEVVVIEGRRP